MSAYRYVLFPHGRQPGREEVDKLKSFEPVLGNQFAFGASRRDGSLAIAFDAVVFDNAFATQAGFEKLIRQWEDRGCQLLDHLAFVKDSSALRPTPPPQSVEKQSRRDADGRRPPAPAELAAKEAIGLSQLQVQRTLLRYETVGRFASAFPYLLIGLAALGTLVIGAYVSSRLMGASRERRQQTIQRVVENPFGPLDAHAAPGEGSAPNSALPR